ncbi:type IX secretion system protein PorD [Aquimarina agarilytica]|uniref:type IX secretion system protein PorD n=1 Tax=Aquimarina agarilytica TaxID=1087449 RepID=UPI000287D49F|nr:DUF4835 family protein [Aquimarina agarilytica]
MRNIFCLLFLCVSTLVGAQEFNAKVTINAEQTGQPNLAIFKTLGTSLEEFINKTRWTDVEYLPQERIDCGFFINVTAYNNNFFEATIQIQSSRPVYDSGYQSTLANFNDKDFSFDYLEYQPLVYNPNSDQGNLISVISYYLYTLLGIEADTLEKLSGTEHYQTAKQIVNIAQSSGGKGWSASSGTTSRYRWNEDILSGTFNDYREALYTYHMEGLDKMSSDAKQAKKKIIEAIDVLGKVNKKRSNSYVMRTFFDAKSIELSRLFSGGPKVDISKTLDLLNFMAPSYKTEWSKIEN